MAETEECQGSCMLEGSDYSKSVASEQSKPKENIDGTGESPDCCTNPCCNLPTEFRISTTDPCVNEGLPKPTQKTTIPLLPMGHLEIVTIVVHRKTGVDAVTTSEPLIAKADEPKPTYSLGVAQKMWKEADAVLFDVDATIIKERTVYELAEFCGATNNVLEWCEQTRSLNKTYTETLGGMMKVINPTRQQVDDFLKTKRYTLSNSVQELFHVLNKKGTSIYLASASYKSLVMPVAQELFIPEENVFANCFRFSFAGEYTGYEEDEPMTKYNGKGLIIKRLKERLGYKTFVNVGDGMTDFIACPPSDLFIGYGGHIDVEYIRKNAGWHIYDFAELIAALDD